MMVLTGYRNILKPRDGAFADVIAVKGDVQMKIPDNLSDTEAATQGISVATMVGSQYLLLMNNVANLEKSGSGTVPRSWCALPRRE